MMMKKVIVYVLVFMLLAQVVLAGDLFQLTDDTNENYYPTYYDSSNYVFYNCNIWDTCYSNPGDTNSKTPLSTLFPETYIWYPYAYNSNSIIAVSEEAVTYDEEMFKFTIGGSSAQITFDNDIDKERPTMCSDGHTFVFCGRTSGGNYNVYKGDINAPGLSTQLTTENKECFYNGYPADCDNTYAYYVCSYGLFNQICKTPLAGGARTLLTTDDAQHTAPVLSQDGTKILFSANTGGGFAKIYEMNLDGTGLTKLSTDDSKNHEFPFQCPDGIVYSSRETISGDRLAIVGGAILYPDITLGWGPMVCGLGSQNIFFTGLDTQNDQQIFQDYTGDPSDPVPEFSTITLLLAALVALGGIFAFRRYR